MLEERHQQLNSQAKYLQEIKLKACDRVHELEVERNTIEKHCETLTKHNKQLDDELKSFQVTNENVMTQLDRHAHMEHQRRSFNTDLQASYKKVRDCSPHSKFSHLLHANYY